ncbi:MAG: plastocyanin/azurin family copper-binding protein [Chloroflexota bacterium]|nr:plastocyanin/azurin family copper-binding protein [Chloroflexota bacterium]
MKLRAGAWSAMTALLFAGGALVGCSGGGTKTVVVTATAPASSGTVTSATAGAPAATAPVSYAPPGAATFGVIAGRADGAFDIERFLPADIHVREGDTIQWTAQGIEGHTITFVEQKQFNTLLSSYLQPDPNDPAQVIFNPEIALKSRTGDTYPGDGTYYNSGFIGVPAEQTYKLTFTKSGLYQYVCLVHPFTMRGTVSVDAASAQVEAPESVTSRGKAELAGYIEEEKRAVAQAAAEPHELPGPSGAVLYRVNVGVTTPYGQAAAFVPAALDIKAGDTVIFENDDRDFHNVVFKGLQKGLPPGIGIIVDAEGRGLNFSLSKESAVAVDPPPGGFDDKTFLSSGSLGILQPRLTWRLQFAKPGTYSFACTIHVLAGMAGVITVR